MKITKTNPQIEWFTNKLHSLIYKIENTGDGDYYRSGEHAFIKELGSLYKDKPFTVFDVGANKGEYTSILLETHPLEITVHAFEPQQSCVGLLNQLFSGKKNIVINPFGLSDTNSTSTLFKDVEDSGFASVYQRNMEYYDIHLNKTEEIRLQTGLEYVTKNNISHIDLLKIDVEGHEEKVFAGFGDFLNPDNIDFIQFEYGGANLDSHSSLLDLHTLLTKKGFILCKMMRNSLLIRPYHPRLENFMYQNWVAASPKMIKG